MNHKRAGFWLIACCIAAGLAVAIPTVLVGSGSEPTSPLSAAPSASVLGGPADQSPLPAGLATLIAENGEADPASGRLLQDVNGQRFYVFKSKTGPERLCTAVSGTTVGVLCVPTRALGSGKVVLPAPIMNGGIGTPVVYFGIVPDGYNAVVVGGTPRSVTRNSFAVFVPDGAPLPELRYSRPDGSTVTVDPLSPN